MRVPTEWESWVGDWQGTNLLWLSEEPIESETTATVRVAAGGSCLCLEYVWRYEGEVQEGILLLGSQGDDAFQGIWRDSFHSGGDFLISNGKANTTSGVELLGHYAAPPGPDWGWRTHLRTEGVDGFEVAMTNIHPDGTEDPAVRMTYRRTETSVPQRA